MSNGFVLILMFFCHIVDDYYLQGWLASAKQKEWWKKNAPNPLYRHDYLWALLMHSASWSFMTMLPIAIAQSFNIGPVYCVIFVANMLIHAFVDNQKANVKSINLWTDQMCHCIQIVSTFLILM